MEKLSSTLHDDAEIDVETSSSTVHGVVRGGGDWAESRETEVGGRREADGLRRWAAETSVAVVVEVGGGGGGDERLEEIK